MTNGFDCIENIDSQSKEEILPFALPPDYTTTLGYQNAMPSYFIQPAQGIQPSQYYQVPLAPNAPPPPNAQTLPNTPLYYSPYQQHLMQQPYDGSGVVVINPYLHQRAIENEMLRQETERSITSACCMHSLYFTCAKSAMFT